MCLAIPMQIESLEGNLAVVDAAGARRQISVALLENAMVGDYVLVHAGFAIQKIDQEQAEETFRFLNEIGSRKPK
jgi:hydrogenase expression/formation protein HypC